MPTLPNRPSLSRPRPLAAVLLIGGALAACAATPPQAPRVAAAAVPAATPQPAPAPSPPPAAVSVAKADPVTPSVEPANGARSPDQFGRWIDDFRSSARAAGIGEATLRAALEQVRYLPRIVELDRAQPEFTRSVWQYLDSAVSAQRIAGGQDKLAQLRGGEIETIAARYRVPLEIIVAIWGIESNYGSNVGSTPVIDALATLGFDGRREAWARGELLAALRILQNGDIDRARMIGSWAGAMGQTQFLPSTFLNSAVDADGDGRRDLWGSIADVVASTANHLARAGWQLGEPWGLEVQLPPGFDHARADADLRQPSSAWAAAGVLTVDGGALPALTDGAILLPAGARGPAFLVGRNFRVILRYNNSTSYALAVGLLAQRLAGGPDVQASWPRDLQALSRSQLLALQTALNARGFDSGRPDGIYGPATRRGIRDFQRSVGLPADGYPTLDLLQRLEAK
ncbi:lytic murein transglycosylase [Piscinibacter sakaiensis]|uniref:lytic murein transglycosylase n=1 Tax=Piscinibacter sakaiensis TaxID=1547922 RepID=UPI003AAE1464